MRFVTLDTSTSLRQSLITNKLQGKKQFFDAVSHKGGGGGVAIVLPYPFDTDQPYCLRQGRRHVWDGDCDP